MKHIQNLGQIARPSVLRISRILAPIIAALALFAPAHAGQITLQDLDHLPPADLYILGETHDNALHHQAQARVLRALKPKAVVFEMLSPEQAARITPALLANPPALAEALDWANSGWPDFALYAPLFAALGDAKIYGAALPKGKVRQAYSEGAAAVFGPGAARYGLDQPVPQAQLEQRKQEQFEAHCRAMPLAAMGGMIEAQRIRDAAFADALLRAHQQVGAPVVLIAGAGHAHYDWAVPAALQAADSGLSLLSVALLEAPAQPQKRYDLWLETAAAEREDPCLAFAK
ncbi:MAG: hypothetical protein CSA68_06830 [Rhodobacterales bacterium]|nr:MAG: hypothetical protein CSA68_06830 [Rhodobacterales bacterium]